MAVYNCIRDTCRCISLAANRVLCLKAFSIDNNSNNNNNNNNIVIIILLIMLTLIIMIIILSRKLQLKIPLHYVHTSLKCDNNRCKINVIVDYFLSILLIWSQKSKLITDYHMIPLLCIPFRIVGLTTSYVWGTKCKHSIYTIFRYILTAF